MLLVRLLLLLYNCAAVSSVNEIKTINIIPTINVIKIDHKCNTRGGERSFKNSGSRKILVEFHGSRSLVFFSGYMRLGVSFFLYEAISGFCKAKGLQVLTYSFTCFYEDFFSSLDNEFK